jgi:hypothetical protein
LPAGGKKAEQHEQVKRWQTEVAIDHGRSLNTSLAGGS